MKHTLLTVFFSLVLILVSAFCITSTVHSQNAQTEREDIRQYYKQIENDYVLAVRSLLLESGYKNSGVTMNHVTDSSGQRTYLVMIHHDKIDRLSTTEKEALLAKCQEISFPEKECEITFDFLE